MNSPLAVTKTDFAFCIDLAPLESLNIDLKYRYYEVKAIGSYNSNHSDRI